MIIDFDKMPPKFRCQVHGPLKNHLVFQFTIEEESSSARCFKCLASLIEKKLLPLIEMENENAVEEIIK